MSAKQAVTSRLVIEAFVATFTLFIILRTLEPYVCQAVIVSDALDVATNIQEIRFNVTRRVATWSISTLAVMFHAQARRKTWAYVLESAPTLRHPSGWHVSLALASTMFTIFGLLSYLGLYWVPSEHLSVPIIGDLRIATWLGLNFIVGLVAWVAFAMKFHDEEIKRRERTKVRDARRIRRHDRYVEKTQSYGTMV